jgi:hypothetical protein
MDIGASLELRMKTVQEITVNGGVFEVRTEAVP